MDCPSYADEIQMRYHITTRFTRTYTYTGIIEADSEAQAAEKAYIVDGDTPDIEASDYDTELELISIVRIS